MTPAICPSQPTHTPQHQACSGSPSGHLPRWQAAQDVWAPQKVSGWRCSVPQSFYSDPRLCPTLWDSSWSWMALPPTPCDPVTGDDNIDASLRLSAVALMDAASSLDYDLEMRWGNGFLWALALHTWRIHKSISLLSWSLWYSFWNDWHSTFRSYATGLCSSVSIFLIPTQ